MARKRNELGPVVEQQMVDMLSRGGTAQSIFDRLSAQGITGISVPTIQRRMRELRAGIRSSGPRPVPATSEAVRVITAVEEIPPDATCNDLDQWIANVTARGKIAEANDDLDGVVKMGRLYTALIEARRKATPPPVIDPNDSPDMVALGAEVAKRFHKMIDQAVSA